MTSSTQPAADPAHGWVDTHCHLDSVDDAVGAVARARAAGITAMVTIGTDLPTSRRAVELASSLPDVWAAVGVHPYDAGTFGDAELDAIRELAASPRVVAVGEVGLDYHNEYATRSEQERAFRRQIIAAKEVGLALVLHIRDAVEEAFAVLEDEGPPERLVFHCFSGGPEDARRASWMGGHVSFAGNVSYRNAGMLREAAAAVPLDRLLVETDSPYLAPVPYRGRRNEPAYVTAVGAAVATATGRTVEEIRAATAANARRVFGMGRAHESFGGQKRPLPL